MTPRSCRNPACGQPVALDEACCGACGTATGEPAQTRSETVPAGVLSQLEDYCREVMRDGHVDPHEARQLVSWRHRLSQGEWEQQLHKEGIDPARIASLAGSQDNGCPIRLYWRPPIGVTQGEAVALRLRLDARFHDVAVRVTLRKDGSQDRIPEWCANCAPHAPLDDVRQVTADVAGDTVVRIRIEIAGDVGRTPARAYEGWIEFSASPPPTTGRASIHVEGSANVVRLEPGHERNGLHVRSAEWTECELRQARDESPAIQVVHQPRLPTHPRVLMIGTGFTIDATRLIIGDSVRVGRHHRIAEHDSHTHNEISLCDGIPHELLLDPHRPSEHRPPFRFLSSRALRISASQLQSGLHVEVQNRSGASLDAEMLSPKSVIPPSRLLSPFEIVLGGTHHHANLRFTQVPRAPTSPTMDDIRLDLGPESLLARESRKSGIGGFLIDVEVAGLTKRYLWLLDALGTEAVGIPARYASGFLISQASSYWLVLDPDPSNRCRAWALEPGTSIELTPRLQLSIGMPPLT